MDAKHEVEITRETVDAAVAAGLEQLGAKPTDVIVEVLEEPSRGILGIGAKPARVRIRLLRPPEPEPVPHAEVTSDSDEEDEDLADEDAYITEGEVIEDEDLMAEGMVAKEILGEILKHMDIRADISIRQGEPSRPGEASPLVVDVSGHDVRNLIGRRGETLNALQYITRLIASRRLQRRANIIVDANEYKLRRSEKLRQLAIRMADQAVQQGRQVSLEPMPPNERRIIHLELREREDVETRSTGEGNSRKVMIIPK